MANENFTFNVSVSTTCYPNKCTEWGKLRYRTMSLDIDGLTSYVRQGYCFTHIFNHSGDDFGCKDKTFANFRETQMVFLDVDDSLLTACNFYQDLTIKPTLLYTTPSNIEGEKNRFRLIYLFNDEIKDKDEYRLQALHVIGSIKENYPDFIYDNTCLSCAQQMGGNGKADCILLRSDRVFSFDDFSKWNNCIPNTYRKKRRNDITHRNADVKEETEIKIQDREFIETFWKIDNTQSAVNFLITYQYKYPIFESTQVSADIPYIDLNSDDYVEISRRYYVTKDKYGNNHSIPVKIKEGNRERILFANALLRLKMNPQITFENLLYAMVYERQIWIDNTDGEFTNHTLYKIAKGAYLNRETYNISNATEGQKRRRKKTNKCGCKVNKAFCDKYGVSVRSMANCMRTDASNKVLQRHYDFSKSVKENSRLLKETGIKPNGERRLYEFVKWYTNQQNADEL